MQNQVALDIQFKSAVGTMDVGRLNVVKILENWNND